MNSVLSDDFYISYGYARMQDYLYSHYGDDCEQALLFINDIIVLGESNQHLTDETIEQLDAAAKYAVMLGDSISTAGVQLNDHVEHHSPISDDLGLSVEVGEPSNGTVELTMIVTDTFGGTRKYVIGASHNEQVPGETELRDVFQIRVKEGVNKKRVVSDGKTLHLMLVAQSIDPLPPKWRGKSVEQGQFHIAPPVDIPDTIYHGNLIIPPNIELGEWRIHHWNSLWGGLQVIYSHTEEDKLIESTDEYMRLHMKPTSKGSAHIQSEAFLPRHLAYSVAFDVMFEGDYDWGGSQEGGKVGFGLSGGDFVGGGRIKPTGFNARFMWRGNKDGTARMVSYLYYADQKNQSWGDDIEHTPYLIETDTWIRYQMDVRLNHHPAKDSGSFHVYRDGELVVEMPAMRWFKVGIPYIDRLGCTNFYGGNSSDWSPASTQFIRFRNITYEAL